MKLKKLDIILGLSIILAVQIVIIILLNIFSSQNIKVKDMEKPLIAGMEKDNVISISIKDYQDTFYIEKKDNQWAIKTKDKYIPANTTKIDNYIKMIKSLTKGITVFEGSDTSSDINFGFDEKNYQVVTIKTDKRDLTIWVGNNGTKRGSSFIRVNDEKIVREVQSSIASDTSNRPIDWSVSNIFDGVTQEDVQEIELISNFEWFKGTYKILYKQQEKQDQETWEMVPPHNKELENFSLQSIVGTALSLNAVDYKLDGDVSGKTPSGTLKIRLKNAQTFLLNFYKADESEQGEYIIQTDFKQYLYYVRADSLKYIFKSPKEMEKKAE